MRGFSGDGGPATAAAIEVTRLWVAPSGAIYFNGGGFPAGGRVRVVGADGRIRTVAGNGRLGPRGDGGPATAAGMLPSAMALARDGSLLVDAGRAGRAPPRRPAHAEGSRRCSDRGDGRGRRRPAAPARRRRATSSHARSAGDGLALDALLRAHAEVAFRTAYLIVGTAADAEDVAQEAFLKAVRALPRFRAGAPFRPWLLRIVANEARNRLRSSARRRRRDALDAVLSSRAEVETPEASLLRAEERLAVRSALARLPRADRVALVGRYFLALDDEEVGALLGVTATSARVRVWRALRRLERIVERDAG